MAKLDLGRPEKFVFAHFFIRNFLFLFWFKIWYKNITIVGKKNLDRKTPTILAINHQNTAMDPLALCGTIFRDITWLARADLYKKKSLVPIFHALKILPIFRQRDGLKSLEDNTIVFEKVVDVISAKHLVGLFPEGTHWGFRRLRQTRKAIPRIVHMAEEKNNFDLDININPIGIYYDDYISVRSNLFVKIGEPIPMRQYLSALKENPQAAENEIREAIEAGMRNTMLDIPQMDETYYTVESLRLICRNQTLSNIHATGNRQERAFAADKKTIELIENQENAQEGYIASLKPMVDAYEEKRKAAKYSYELVENNGDDAFSVIWNCMKTVVLLPLFLISCVFYALPYWVMNKLGDTFAKDILFRNSIMFVGGLLLVIVVHLILAILWLTLVPLPWWTVFLFILGITLLWPVFIDYPRLVNRTGQELQFKIGLLTKSAKITELCSLRDTVKNEFAKLL